MPILFAPTTMDVETEQGFIRTAIEFVYELDTNS